MSPADDGHTPDQRGLLLDGILFLVSLLLMLQLWLLTGTMEAFLGGDLEIAWPAALASSTPGRIAAPPSMPANPTSP